MHKDCPWCKEKSELTFWKEDNKKYVQCTKHTKVIPLEEWDSWSEVKEEEQDGNTLKVPHSVEQLAKLIYDLYSNGFSFPDDDWIWLSPEYELNLWEEQFEGLEDGDEIKYDQFAAIYKKDSNGVIDTQCWKALDRKDVKHGINRTEI